MKKKIGVITASAIVVANMIGTGVFTSVGYQLSSSQNTWTILLLWIFGGLLSLFGAFAYSELGTHFKESGGDYIYLSRIFHPLAGYLSAWTGLTVGFSAPVAIAAIALVRYLAPFGLTNGIFWAVSIIVITGVMHSVSVKQSSRFHNIMTIIKILFLTSLILLGMLLTSKSENALMFTDSWKREIFTPGFAVSMIYVSYAYTGWNAAAYISGEIDNPRKNLPRALILSTGVVSVLYVIFQFALLKHASLRQLEGREDVSFIAFTNLLGTAGGKWVSFFIAFQLVATISSYLWVGSRVTHAMAQEHRLWRKLAGKNANGIPVAAIWAHVVVSVLLTLTNSFEQVLLYCGFVLQLMASLTVATSLFIRDRDPAAFRSPLRPYLQIIFLLFSLAVLVFTFLERPKESLFGIGILAAGTVIYFFDRPVQKPADNS